MAALFVLAACKPAPVPAPNPVVQETTTKKIVAVLAGDQELPRMDGQGYVRLDAMRGESFLLYVYGPWTDGGRVAREQVKELESTGLKVQPVVVDRQADSLASGGFSEPGRLPAVRGDDVWLEAAGPLRALPTTLLVGPDGALRKAWPGHVAFTNIHAALNSGGNTVSAR